MFVDYAIFQTCFLTTMSSLSGVLSLHDAFATEETFPSLNPHKLALGGVEDRRTRFPSYHQPLLYDGKKLVIQTPAVEISDLDYHQYSAGDAILIPVSPWLRQQFNIIDAFLRDAVTIPQNLRSKWPYVLNPDDHDYYKPICHLNPLYLIMSPTCCMTQEDDTTEIPMKTRPVLREGLYSLTLEFSHVYMGWHHYGCLYSVNFRVTRIHYKPNVKVSSI